MLKKKQSLQAGESQRDSLREEEPVQIHSNFSQYNKDMEAAKQSKGIRQSFQD